MDHFRIIDVRVVGVNFRLKNVQRMFNEPIVKKVHKIFQMDIKFLRKYSNAFRNFISGPKHNEILKSNKYSASRVI